MRKITKSKEPQSLTQHKAQEFSDYDNYEEKDELRGSLVAEQRGICCYCMGAIKADRKYMKIEHFRCRENYPQLQLEYKNLFGACWGNYGHPEHLQHCDTRKGDRDLSRDPTEALFSIEDLVSYNGNGIITSTDPIFDNELNKILNLNLPYLKNQRKAALDGFIMLKLSKKKGIQRSTIVRWLQEWNGELDKRPLKPYCQVIVYWLYKRLKRG